MQVHNLAENHISLIQSSSWITKSFIHKGEVTMFAFFFFFSPWRTEIRVSKFSEFLELSLAPMWLNDVVQITVAIRFPVCVGGFAAQTEIRVSNIFWISWALTPMWLNDGVADYCCN